MKKTMVLLGLSMVMLTGCSSKGKEEVIRDEDNPIVSSQSTKTENPKKKGNASKEVLVEYDNFVIKGSEDFEQKVNDWNIIEDSFRQEVYFDAILNDGIIRNEKNKIRAENGLGEDDIWVDDWFEKNHAEIKSSFDMAVEKYGFSSSEENVTTLGDIVMYEGFRSQKQIGGADISIKMSPNFGQTTVEYTSTIDMKDYNEEFKESALKEVRELLGLDINKEQIDLILDKFLNFSEEEIAGTKSKMCSCAELSHYDRTASIYVDLTAYNDIRQISFHAKANGNREPDFGVILDN